MKPDLSKKKKAIIIGFVSVCVLMLVLVLISSVLSHFNGKVNRDIPRIDYTFYDPDWESDIFSEEGYLSKNRNIAYTDENGQTIGINEINSAQNGVGAAFFSVYFYALQTGDNELYNSLFSSEYIDKNGEKDDFTEQRVYDIELKYLYDEKISDSLYSITYALDYCIMRNDGTFRRDIGSDMSRTQYVTLCYDENGAYISGIKTEYAKN